MRPSWHLFTHELTRNRNKAIAWTTVVSSMVLLYSAFIPTIIKSGDAIAAVIEAYPKAMLRAFNIEDVAMIVKPLGFHVTESGTMILILGGIFAVSLGANLLLKEERDQTAEFLLAQPLSRRQVWLSKTAASMVYVVGFNAVITAVSIAAISGFSPDPIDVGALLSYNTYVLLLTVLLASVGLLLSAAVRRGRSMNGVAVAIALGGFFVDSISKIAEAAQAIGYLSPYRFVDTSILNHNYGLSIGRLSYFLIGSALLLTASSMIYQKKDISL